MPNGKIRFAAVYGAGAAMGWTPQEVDRMSLWQWNAAIEGFAAAHDPKAGNKLSADEVSELFAWIDAGPANDRVLETVIYDWDGAGLIRLRTIRFKG